MKNDPITKIAEVLLDAESVDIITHILMDGDAIGSAAALCLAMRQKGKKARVLLEDGIADYLRFLDKGCCVGIDEADPAKADVAVIVDCGDYDRFPERREWFDGAAKTVCIDHHKTSGIAAYNYVDPGAPATGVLIYDLLEAMDVVIDEDIAEEIFAAVATDTGNFMYQNTTKKAHEVVCALYDAGIDAYGVSCRLYENEKYEKIALHADAIENAEILFDGKLMIGTVSREMLERNGADFEDTEGLVSTFRSIMGVEAAALLKEKEEKVTKVSLRSKEYADVARVAEKFEGGGHSRAAGCTIYEDLDTAKRMLLEALEEEICRG